MLHALIFDFLNHRTGRLDPSYAAIAAKAGVCVRTVATALKRLRELGILNWVRRCAERWADGRFVLEQETNAYGRRASGSATGRHWRRRSQNGGGRLSCPLRSPKRRSRPIPRPRRRWLAVNAMTPLERALACFQRSILARDS